jgi:carboxylesterase type B
MSEDCLYLNIIRPAGLTNASGLPVAVWIHGGGFLKGGGSDRRYNYSFAVQDSVEMGNPFIGITINYRLSVWGWLMGKEALDAGAVNLGYHDMRQSLRWIHENIGDFGGDPMKVTIVGQSCGAEALAAQILAYNGENTVYHSPILIYLFETRNSQQQVVMMVFSGLPLANPALGDAFLDSVLVASTALRPTRTCLTDWC